jgi:hypothetical protein
MLWIDDAANPGNQDLFDKMDPGRVGVSATTESVPFDSALSVGANLIPGANRDATDVSVLLPVSRSRAKQFHEGNIATTW